MDQIDHEDVSSDPVEKYNNYVKIVRVLTHDLNSKLAVISWRSDLAITNLEPEAPAQKDIAYIKKAVEGALEITAKLSTLSHHQLSHPKITNLTDLVSELETMIKRIVSRDIDLSLNLRKDLHSVKVDPEQVEQIIAIMTISSRNSMPDGGCLKITTENTLLNENKLEVDEDQNASPYVKLTITDSGLGMTTDEVTGLLHFGTTPEWMRQGTDVDINNIVRFVNEYKGYFTIESEKDKGTTWIIYLPSVKPALPKN